MMEWKKLLSPHRVGSSRPGEISQARSPFQRDFDRIVFSSSFRRLQDKTQVFPLAKTDYVRTRLTHSLEASSVARSLGSAVGVHLCREFDMGDAQPSDVGAAVAAAALAHDIGNPPLGHAGEEAIRHWFTHSPVGKAMRDVMNDDEAADLEFYEGNAQGFRVLTRLEMPDQAGGMQLTCATLAAFAKYPCASRVMVRPTGVAGKKFNFFRAEEQLFREMAEHTGLVQTGPWAWQRHPLAYLVEAADDIAYRIVDFEDGQRLGLVSYQELEQLFLEIIDSERSAEYVATIASPNSCGRRSSAGWSGSARKRLSIITRNCCPERSKNRCCPTSAARSRCGGSRRAARATSISTGRSPRSSAPGSKWCRACLTSSCRA